MPEFERPPDDGPTVPYTPAPAQLVADREAARQAQALRRDLLAGLRVTALASVGDGLSRVGGYVVSQPTPTSIFVLLLDGRVLLCTLNGAVFDDPAELRRRLGVKA